MPSRAHANPSSRERQGAAATAVLQDSSGNGTDQRCAAEDLRPIFKATVADADPYASARSAADEGGPRLRTIRVRAALVACLLLVTGCSSTPSYAALAKVARSVPVPDGLVFVREVDHVNHAAGFAGRDENAVDLLFSNTKNLDCVQLSAAWREAIHTAGWKIDTADSGTGPGAFYLKKNGLMIAVDPGGSSGVCGTPSISAMRTP